MTVTPTTFRTTLPEFSNTATYSDATIQNWICFGELYIQPPMWDDSIVDCAGLTFRDRGITFFAAHYLAMQQSAILRSQYGGVPGTNVGVVNSVSANGASVGYDTGIGSNDEWGPFNNTIYGQIYMQMSMLVGMKPLQIGVGCAPLGVAPPFFGQVPAGYFVGPAWPGPNPNPGIFG